VIFCTGAGTSGWLGFGTDLLAGLDLRLVAIDRPGLGGSTGHPGKTLTSWAADVADLVAARRLERPVAVGFSQGAPFALALAAHRVTAAVAIVSGQDELAHHEVRPTLASGVAALVDAVQADSDGVEREFADSASADQLWRLVIDTSAPGDRLRYTSPEFARAYRRALAEGFAHGAAGYARDLVLALAEWPFCCEQIDVPVAVWYGRDDASPVHSPDLGATLARRLPSATRTVIQGVGSSVLWTHAEDILVDLVGQARP
jgi:pimeloyl-ACP methyl ester carboxylesterase